MPQPGALPSRKPHGVVQKLLPVLAVENTLKLKPESSCAGLEVLAVKVVDLLGAALPVRAFDLDSRHVVAVHLASVDRGVRLRRVFSAHYAARGGPSGADV